MYPPIPHPLAASPLSAFGGPMTATGADYFGVPSSATTAAEILESFDDQLDLILDGDPTPDGAGSTSVGRVT